MTSASFTGLVRLLQATTAVAFALALVGAFGLDGAATAAVGVVIAAPLVRVAWLAVRWARKGDVRFAALAVTLLAVVAAGRLLA